MIKKNNYEQPSAELIVVRFEKEFLTGSPGDGDNGRAGGLMEGDEYELG